MDIGKRALFYARKGFAVLPLHTIDDGDRCSCGKAVCRCDGRCDDPIGHCASAGKHPVGHMVPNGVLDASRDDATITQWWAGFPDANIGITTGDASGIVVVDIDIKAGGDITLDDLQRRFGALEPTWCVETGSGGIHLYYRMPDADVRNSAGMIGPGIDVRGNGGYVVAPPSLHASGERYRWSRDWHPNTVPLAELPPWLLERMMPPSSRRAAPPIPHRIPEGMRNTMLTSVAGSMRRRGLDRAAILAALKITNATRCDPPLPDWEVERIAQSIERYPPEPMLSLGRRYVKTA